MAMLPLLHGCTAKGGAAGDNDIRAVAEARVRAFNAKDLTAFMQLYAPGSELSVFNVIPPRQYDREAFERDWYQVFKMFNGPAKLDMTDLAITAGSGDVAFSHSVQHLTGTRVDGKKTDIILRVTDGYRKIDGKWVIAHEHISVPVDTESGVADLQSKVTPEHP